MLVFPGLSLLLFGLGCDAAASLLPAYIVVPIADTHLYKHVKKSSLDCFDTYRLCLGGL